VRTKIKLWTRWIAHRKYILCSFSLKRIWPLLNSLFNSHTENTTPSAGFWRSLGQKVVISESVKRFQVSAGRSGLVKLARLFPRAAIHWDTLAPFIMSEYISLYSLVSYMKLLNSQISSVMGRSGQNRAGFGQIRKWFSSEVDRWSLSCSLPLHAVIINSYPCYAQHILAASVQSSEQWFIIRKLIEISHLPCGALLLFSW